LLRLGGQAEVYLARHPTLNQTVVIKWAHQTITADPRVADQFTREARLLAGLKHRHFPVFHDLGIAEDRPYLVLEHIAGGSLADDARRPRCPKTAALLIARVARVLHTVHDYGMLHLDIQPDNILLGHDGEPRLIDFGSSLPRSAGPEQRHAATPHGAPEYMAPEQLAGDTERLGVATDVYGLGAVLHELVFGAPPQPEFVWTGPVTACPVRRSEPPVPRKLQEICRRALHPDPERRYGSALEFACDLEHVAAGRRPLTAAIVAGPLVLSIALLTPVRHILPAMVTTTPITCEADHIHPRVPVIAEAVGRLLHGTGVGDRSASIFLADGRSVPLRRENDCRSPREFAEHVARDVAAQPGTTLLLFSDNHNTDEDQKPRLRDLPAGTIAQITDSDFVILAHTSSDVPALEAAVQNVQRQLCRRYTRFTALVLTAGPAAQTSVRRPISAPPNNRTAASSDPHRTSD